MRLQLVAVGVRMPAWVSAGYREYAERLPRDCRLELVEIPPPRRTKNSELPRLLATEAARIQAVLAPGVRRVALDVNGRNWSTPQLAKRLAVWLADGRDVALLVGGPDGLAAELLASADERWSLSPLTFPHPLVRVMVAEQLYRAWSILNNHPYHRA